MLIEMTPLRKILRKLIILLFFPLVLVNARDALAVAGDSAWQQALPGWQYRFPTDHAIHSDYKTEWWYFTGNIQDERGHEYGYELTFFRQGILSPKQQDALTEESPTVGRFVQSDFKFAHFAISDISGKRFYFVQKMSRGAFGDAGFSKIENNQPANSGTKANEPLAWMEDWSLKPQPDGTWKIAAEIGGETPMSIDLKVASLKPPVIEGTDGVSQKAAGLGNASHYYSFTRLQTTGTLSLGKDTPKHNVHGDSWFDHEWASNQMATNQVGWNWFCFQFKDGTEMMLYAMRQLDGNVDPVSSGTWIAADGHTEHLRREDFQFSSLGTWKSPHTGAIYPLEWRVSLPARQIQVSVTPRLEDQELVLPGISYWEGAIAFTGQCGEKQISGVGYMELTGYAAALQGLQGEQSASGNRLSSSPR